MAEPRDDVAAPGSAAPPETMREIVDRVRRITRENERLFQRLIEGESRFRGLADRIFPYAAPGLSDPRVAERWRAVAAAVAAD